jgi:hypothetical protein
MIISALVQVMFNELSIECPGKERNLPGETIKIIC